MITPEELEKAGWKLMGNSWYGPSGKKLTNFDCAWQKWVQGVSVIVTTMNEL